MLLTRKFYQQNTLKVARNLVGCFLVRKTEDKIVKATITETEAYIGEDDLGLPCVQRPDQAHGNYVRRSGTRLCLSDLWHVSLPEYRYREKRFPRRGFDPGIKIDNIDYKKTNGPGKLCKFLKIDRKLNGWDMTKKEKLWIASPRLRLGGRMSPKKNIVADKRIGIDYAKHCKEYFWRFSIDWRNKYLLK